LLGFAFLCVGGAELLAALGWVLRPDVCLAQPALIVEFFIRYLRPVDLEEDHPPGRQLFRAGGHVGTKLLRRQLRCHQRIGPATNQVQSKIVTHGNLLSRRISFSRTEPKPHAARIPHSSPFTLPYIPSHDPIIGPNFTIRPAKTIDTIVASLTRSLSQGRAVSSTL